MFGVGSLLFGSFYIVLLANTFFPLVWGVFPQLAILAVFEWERRFLLLALQRSWE